MLRGILASRPPEQELLSRHFLWAQRTAVSEIRKSYALLLFLTQRVVNPGVKAKLSAVNQCTLYLTGQAHPLSLTWTVYLRVWGTYDSWAGRDDRTCPQRTACVSLASWGALITPMSYPNWKEPSTAVKTVKAKVPVIWGWEIKLGSGSVCRLTSHLCRVDSGRVRSFPPTVEHGSPMLSRACLILRECGSCPTFYIANAEREREKRSRTAFPE